MGIIPISTMTSPTIVFDDVTVARAHDVVLTVPELQITSGYTALVGPNGSGKSTMLHVIAGLLEPRSGSVSIGGAPAVKGSPDVAYVLQSQHGSQHLLVTAREVVGLGRAGSRGLFGRATKTDTQAIDEAMERLDVASLGGRHLADMSGGQRQRVFIAQGLAQQAPILLLDEPVAGLDLASAQTIRRAVEDERNAGRSVIVATHDLDEAARADCVAMLNGRVIACGAPADVLRTENLREAYQGRVLEIGDGLVVDDGVHHDHHH